jgi:hypothetical protein
MDEAPDEVYRVLDGSRDEIRLLRLKSKQYNHDIQKDGETIICSLENKSLRAAGEFIAISYTWENGCENQEIYLSGHGRLASANLVDALRQLRKETDDVMLWADQLCINQADPTEKAAQIQKLTDIYQQATTVIAWLGSSADDSDLVFIILRQMSNSHTMSLNTCLLSEVSRELGEVESDSKKRDWDQVMILDALGKALPAFSSRRYWSRLWVLQEFVLATNVLVMCGSETLTDVALRKSWKMLGKALKHTYGGAHKRDLSEKLNVMAIADIWRNNPMWWDAWLGIDRLISQRTEYHTRRQRRESHHVFDRILFMVMYRTLTTFSGQISMACSDPRDRIFSLLGLATDQQEFDHFPDYTRNAESVYEEIAEKFILQGHIDLLSFCQEDVNHRERNMATWAVDWSMKIRIPVWGKLPINSSHNWDVTLAPSIQDDNTIVVNGTFVGKINAHGGAIPKDKPMSRFQMRLFLQTLSAFCNRSTLIPSKEKIFACSQIAAPTAAAYLGDKNWMVGEYLAMLKDLEDSPPLPDEYEEILDVENMSRYETELRLQLFKCPLIMDTGHVGIAPPYILKEDVICIFPGGSTPTILRPCPGGDKFMVIGTAYIHGIMNGEYFNAQRRVRSFSLV